MRHKASELADKNQFLTRQKVRKIKDIIYRNKVRESYFFNEETKEYPDVPAEVIKKNRISD